MVGGSGMSGRAAMIFPRHGRQEREARLRENPAIHVFFAARPLKTWMPGDKPGHDAESVGWAKRSVPTCLAPNAGRWARRKRAFAHPTIFAGYAFAAVFAQYLSRKWR